MIQPAEPHLAAEAAGRAGWGGGLAVRIAAAAAADAAGAGAVAREPSANGSSAVLRAGREGVVGGQHARHRGGPPERRALRRGVERQLAATHRRVVAVQNEI